VAHDDGVVDLRSDTLTRPTAGMRRAMAEAAVGDDVYGEDPSVNALEAEVAALFGREAAVYVPSGTMGNQICLRLNAPAATEVLCDADAHIVTYEEGGAAQHGGIQTRTLVSDRGILDPDAVAGQLRPAGWGTVPTSCVAVENTHNRGGGAVYPLPVLESLAALTAGHGMALHCDGARIWNAHVATGTPLATYGRLFTTLSVCLSKGLGAPVGSVIVCDAGRTGEVRALRRRLGGAMRQAGVLAAAGRYALAHHLERLAEDHARARRIAEAVGAPAPDTNIVRFAVPDARAFAAAAEAEGVLVGITGPTQCRAVTHLDLDDAAVTRAAAILAKLVS
jgi:threonine aldolase